MGRHIWEFAQMADALGKRTFELRMPEQHSIPPVPEYDAFLKDIIKGRTTGDRTATLYDGVIPGVIARFKLTLRRPIHSRRAVHRHSASARCSISNVSARTRPNCSAS